MEGRHCGGQRRGVMVGEEAGGLKEEAEVVNGREGSEKLLVKSGVSGLSSGEFLAEEGNMFPTVVGELLQDPCHVSVRGLSGKGEVAVGLGDPGEQQQQGQT